MIKLWRAEYEHRGDHVVHARIEFEAPDLLGACQRFDWWFGERQSTDEVTKSLTDGVYWGRLLSVKIYGWAPYSIDVGGKLHDGTLGLAGEGSFEWKIDNPGGVDFIEWARNRLRNNGSR